MFFRTLKMRKSYRKEQHFLEYFYSPQIFRIYKNIRSIEIKEMVSFHMLFLMLFYIHTNIHMFQISTVKFINIHVYSTGHMKRLYTYSTISSQCN